VLNSASSLVLKERPDWLKMSEKSNLERFSLIIDRDRDWKRQVSFNCK
jgi:hypothetical protein